MKQNDEIMEQATKKVDKVFDKLGWKVQEEVRLCFINKEYCQLMERKK